MAVVYGEPYLCVREYPLRHPAFPFGTLVLQVALGTDHEEGLQTMDSIQFLEVVVSTVKDIVSTCFTGHFIHCFGIVDGCRRDMEEGRNLCFQVIERMKLYATLMLAEPCPPEHIKAQGYCRGVEGIDVSVKPEDVRLPFTPCLTNEVVGILLKDTVVAVHVCLGKVAPCYMPAKTEMIAFPAMGFNGDNQVTQALAIA